MQTNGELILLFPAWPLEWNVHFKLHAPGKTTVEATLKEGKVTDLKVSPEDEREIIGDNRFKRQNDDMKLRNMNKNLFFNFVSLFLFPIIRESDRNFAVPKPQLPVSFSLQKSTQPALDFNPG